MSKTNDLSLRPTDEELEIVNKLKEALKIKSNAQVLRSAIYALAEKNLTDSRNFTRTKES